MNENQVKNTYAAFSLNDSERSESSSGGIFSLLAKAILSDGGVVYGTAMSADCRRAEVIRADDEAGLDRIRKSKYLQAHTGKTFRQVKEDLDAGRSVLFTGTGCQVNGLIGFLGAGGVQTAREKYPRLYCADVICHGVPSPALWQEYVDYIEKQNNARLTAVNFRRKLSNQASYGVKIIDDKHRELCISKDDDPYMLMFLRNYCLRPSCYECRAKEIKLSDITIADFWGIQNVAPEMADGNGTSLVLVRTDKGKELFNKISENIKIKEVGYADGVACNPSEYKSVARPIQRDFFFDDMKKLSFEELKAKYGTPEAPAKIPFKRKIKSKIKNILIKAKIIGGGTAARGMDYCLCFYLMVLTSNDCDLFEKNEKIFVRDK